MRPISSSTRSRTGRWCSRALLVLGGAVAGTAAAWALSTPPASASPAAHRPNDDARPVVDVASSGVGHLADSTESAVADTVPAHGPGRQGAAEATDGQAPAGGQPAPDSVTDAVRDSAGTAGEPDRSGILRAGDPAESSTPAEAFPRQRLRESAGRVVDAVTRLLSGPPQSRHLFEDAFRSPKRLDEVGAKVWELLSPGERTGLLPLPHQPPERAGPAGTTGNTGPPSAPGALRSASPATPCPETPTAHDVLDGAGASLSSAAGTTPWAHAVFQRGGVPLSPGSVPPAPLVAPSAPATSVGGGHLDGPQVAVPAAELSAFDSAAIGSPRSGARSLHSQRPSQPGVSPD